MQDFVFHLSFLFLYFIIFIEFELRSKSVIGMFTYCVWKDKALNIDFSFVG